MLLTKLEIKGFKSFGDRVVFNFDEGITAVVGPNGSGKSNVVDAIRWVLGEQSSRALRSDKMENVIFNGTTTRRQQQMAEVSLTFKNTRNLLPAEYSEVAVTRRYYRSGDSEYLLNGVTCRLKDIQNLFMDTGIGPDSYAIIELKMVDEILNDQNQSRRTLFEEAAGISKFKKRKKETLKKLEETSADLERVEDLLHEIAKNMRSLERQARQAERFLQIKKEYRQLSLEVARKSVGRQMATVQRLNGQVQQEEDSRTATVSRQRKTEAWAENLRAELIKKEQLLASRQKTLNQHMNKIRQFESDKKIKNERLKFLSERAGTLQKQLEEDKKSNERASFSLEGLDKEKSQLEKMLRETEFVLEEYRRDYQGQKQKTELLKQQAQELGQRSRSIRDQVYQLKKTLEISQVQQSSLKQELDREETDSSAKTASLEEFDNKLAILEAQLHNKQERYQQLQTRKEELQQQIKAGEASLRSLEEQLAKSARLLDARRNEYNLTKSMLDNLEGYPQAIKFLKKNTAWGKQALLLSDIIACDEKYRVCIENYLEPYLNYYILHSGAQAMEGVNLLSNAAKGKGNFFILGHFNSYQPRSYRQFEDAVPAVELLEFDEEYRYLVHFLLDGVYIVTKNQEHLPPDPDVTFVTQNGKIIRRKYSISGGSVGLFEGKKIGRARNLEKLAATIRELEQKNRKLEEAITAKKDDIAWLQEELPGEEVEQLNRESSLLQQDFITLKTRKEQFTELLQDQENKRENMLEKLAQLQQTVEQTLPALAQAEEQLEIVENSYHNTNDELETQQELFSQRSAAFNQQNILFHQQSNRLESLANEIAYKENTFDKGKARIENNQRELQHTEQEIGSLKATSNEHEEQLLALYDEKKSVEEGVNEAERDYYATRGEIAENEKLVRELQRKKEDIESLLMEMKEQRNQENMEVAAVKERVQIEFNVGLDHYINENPEPAPEDESELREKARQLRDKMEKTGPVNHMAIEAYQEVKERHDFIVTQRDDLLSSIESLNATIIEIDQVARDNFMNAFSKVRENFQEVFRSLFTAADTCDLILLDPDDPLQSKIEILARPKGKKPLTINQLSGGEKTLTATALLFAIYLLKPAPFCIFDEVDAPLDDANIDKFNNIIKKFSKNSQFIVVTHNKRTMASTDIVYGITMVEQGISTVVPVDLRQMET